MKKLFNTIVGLILCLNLFSQGGTTGAGITGTGTASNIAMFTSSKKIGNSSITQQTDNIKFNKGNICIGGLATATTIPAIYLNKIPTAANYNLADNSGQFILNGESQILSAINGNIRSTLTNTSIRHDVSLGIGATPLYPLHVQGTSYFHESIGISTAPNGNYSIYAASKIYSGSRFCVPNSTAPVFILDGTSNGLWIDGIDNSSSMYFLSNTFKLKDNNNNQMFKVSWISGQSVINVSTAPTSSVGLSSGDLYKDAGCTCIKYVP